MAEAQGTTQATTSSDDVKPGWKTSEFWLALAAIVGIFTMVGLGKIDMAGALALIPVAFLAVGYSHGRATVKAAASVIFCVFFLSACSSSPTPDPNNGVSSASYRKALQDSSRNVSQIAAELRKLKLRDLAQATPLLTTSAWDAEIAEADQTQKLCDATLSGSTASPSPAPPSPGQ